MHFDLRKGRGKRRPVRPLWALVLCMGFATACQAARPEARPSIGLSMSAIPNVGLAAEASLPFRRIGSFDTSLSGRFTHQWFDDANLADDGFEAAGDWTQFDFGLLGHHELSEGHFATLRLAAVWMRARGQPNIIDKAGDYFGAGIGVGLRTRIARDWHFGPELLVFFGHGEGEYVKTPQLVWGLHWSPEAR